jgi:hypothetical protein
MNPPATDEEFRVARADLNSVYGDRGWSSEEVLKQVEYTREAQERQQRLQDRHEVRPYPSGLNLAGWGGIS